MPFKLTKGDITKINVDAVVNAANESLLGGGGVDGAIHFAAGPELLKECRTLGGCKTGQAKITKGYNMPCKYIIHTPGPVWCGGDREEAELLYSCYHESLLLAKEYECESIAFPLISSGVFGYPKDKALLVAEKAIKDFLKENDMDITLVIFNGSNVELEDDIKDRVNKYIKLTYAMFSVRSGEVNVLNKSDNLAFCLNSEPKSKSPKIHLFGKSDKESRKAKFELLHDVSDVCEDVSSEEKCDEEFKVTDLSFSQTLLDIIDKKGLKDSEVYKKANIDRRLFSKIRSDVNYRPKKQTAVAFAIALELDMNETADLLSKAGFILSNSLLFDVIIKHYIETGNYDIYEINNVLFSYDQTLIGA